MASARSWCAIAASLRPSICRAWPRLSWPSANSGRIASAFSNRSTPSSGRPRPASATPRWWWPSAAERPAMPLELCLSVGIPLRLAICATGSGGYTAGMLVSPSRLGAIEEIETGLRWDAAVLGAEIGRRVARLLRLEVVRSSRVAIACGGGADFFADLLAVWSLGATAICLDPALTLSERENVLAFAKPDVVLIARDTSIRHTHAWTAGPPEPGDPALVLFTSGTTAAPKGVLLSFGAIAARIASNVAQVGEGALARTLITLPTHFGHGLIGNALTPLLSGGTVVMPPSGTALANDLGRLIDRYRIGFLTSVPALWRMALRI